VSLDGAYTCAVTCSTHYADEPGQRMDVAISPINSQAADRKSRCSLSGLRGRL